MLKWIAKNMFGAKGDVALSVVKDDVKTHIIDKVKLVESLSVKGSLGSGKLRFNESIYSFWHLRDIGGGLLYFCGRTIDGIQEHRIILGELESIDKSIYAVIGATYVCLIYEGMTTTDCYKSPLFESELIEVLDVCIRRLRVRIDDLNRESTKKKVVTRRMHRSMIRDAGILPCLNGDHDI